jgi:hypothetical protein
MPQQIKSILIWIFGTTRKDALSSIVAILTAIGLILQLMAKKDISVAEISIGMGQIIGMLMVGKTASLSGSED